MLTCAQHSQLSQIPLPPPGPHAMPTPATTVAFDTHQDLLWAGNDYVSLPTLPREPSLDTRIIARGILEIILAMEQ